MNRNELAIIGEKQMTVKEISESTGTPIRTVHDAIDRILPGIKKNGLTLFLNEAQVALVSAELKKAHNVDLASTRKVATTDIEMMQQAAKVMQWLNGKIKEQEARIDDLEKRNEGQTKTITDMTPKAEFFDTVTDSKDAIAMDQAAKVIDFVGVGRNNLFAFLRDRKVLDNSNLPYQKYIDAGWFRVIETKYNTPNGDVRIYQKTLVYQRGLNAIIRSLLQHGYEKRNATAELL